MITDDFKQMVLDHMEIGFLENIIDMFRADKSLFGIIPDMLQDERVRVRLGTAALVEELLITHPYDLEAQIPALGRLLQAEQPTVRGDVAYILGILKNKKAIPYLENASDDENEAVREIVLEAIDEIQSSGPD
jgi:hypothetical protein